VDGAGEVHEPALGVDVWRSGSVGKHPPAPQRDDANAVTPPARMATSTHDGSGSFRITIVAVCAILARLDAPSPDAVPPEYGAHPSVVATESPTREPDVVQQLPHRC